MPTYSREMCRCMNYDHPYGDGKPARYRAFPCPNVVHIDMTDLSQDPRCPPCKQRKCSGVDTAGIAYEADGNAFPIDFGPEAA